VIAVPWAQLPLFFFEKLTNRKVCGTIYLFYDESYVCTDPEPLQIYDPEREKGQL